MGGILTNTSENFTGNAKIKAKWDSNSEYELMEKWKWNKYIFILTGIKI